MRFVPTAIPDVIVVELDVFTDARGWFTETYHAEKFAKGGINVTFVQDNRSYSKQGTLRGLHYQTRQPQGKLIQVVTGEVFDVVVDLRTSSPTFGRCVEVKRGADTKQQLWVPPGFAHGFYVLSDAADVSYKCTALYAPEHERTIRWDDPDLAINWPLVDGKPPIVSHKDAEGALFKEAEYFA